MKPVQIICGVLAGATGAAAWAAVAYYANLEIGYLAWGIGAAVGVAVAASGENSTAAGVLAVLITVASICLGKFAVVEINVNKQLDEVAAAWDEEALEITDEDLQAHQARQLAEQREESGETLQWPEVADDEESVAASFPVDVWKEAGRQLRSKSKEDIASLREDMKAETAQAIAEFKEMIAGEAVKEGFFSSFGVMDLLFFGLAVATSWGIASGEEE